jgi:hypothetical protein
MCNVYGLWLGGDKPGISPILGFWGGSKLKEEGNIFMHTKHLYAYKCKVSNENLILNIEGGRHSTSNNLN